MSENNVSCQVVLGVEVRRVLARALRCACAASGLLAALVTGVAGAQESLRLENSASIHEVVVTGTRIRTAVSATANPVTVVGAQEIASAKSVSFEDIVRKQPELDNNGGGRSSNLNNNGGNGQTTVGLRNLNYARTLVLIDGHRTVNSNGGISVDLDSIPTSMVERIEILKAGASSVYGADGIGGVINIITKKSFDGLDINTSIGESTHNDQRSYNVDVTAGVNFDRGNITVGAGIVDRDPLLQVEHDWAMDQFIGTPAQGLGPNSTSLPGATTTIPGVGAVYFYGPANQFVVTTPPGGQPTDSLAAQNIAPPPGVTFFPGTGYRYEFGRDSWMSSKLEQRNFALSLRYDVADNIELFLSSSYTNKVASAELSPFAVFQGSQTRFYPGFYIPAFLEDYTWDNLNRTLTRTVVGGPNPGNPFGQTLQVRTRLSTPPRFQRNDYTTLRSIGGLKGTIGAYEWEAGISYGRTTGVFTEENAINFNHLAQMAGQRPCGADVAEGCSVANFLGVNTLTPAQLDYLTFTRMFEQKVAQKYGYAELTGPLFRLPWSDEVAFAVGVETREESLFSRPDDTILSGHAAFGSSITEGDYTVHSGFLELNFPLLVDQPLAKSLSLNLSGRYDDYSTSGSSRTWKPGLEWAVNNSLRLRGSYSTSFRAPSVAELFGGRFRNVETGRDPCSAGGAFAGSPQCVADLAAVGVDGATFVTSLAGGQLPVTGQGNPNLRPETAEGWTAGFVLTPTVLPNLSASFDYYEIDVSDPVGSFSGQDVLNACYGPARQRCDQIQRGPTGDLTNIDSFQVNAPGGESTSGIDFALNYALPVGAGQLDAGLIGTYLLSHEIDSGTGRVVDQAGHFNFGNTAAEPYWRTKFNLRYSRGALGANWATRYYGGVANVDGSARTPGNFAGSYVLHDVALSWNPGSMRYMIGAENVFDRDPPFFRDGGANSLPTAFYDYVGRYVYAKIGVSF